MWNLQWCLTDNKYTSWWENCSTFKYAHSWINVQWKDASELLAVQIVFVHKQMQIALLRRLLNKYKGQKHSRTRRTMDFCKHIQTRNVLVQCHISASHMPTRLTTHVELLSQRLIPQPIGKSASSGSASNIALKLQLWHLGYLLRRCRVSPSQPGSPSAASGFEWHLGWCHSVWNSHLVLRFQSPLSGWHVQLQHDFCSSMVPERHCQSALKEYFGKSRSPRNDPSEEDSLPCTRRRGLSPVFSQKSDPWI